MAGSPSCRSPRRGCDYESSKERISTGVARLDAMLGGQGVYRGSSVLVSGHGWHRQEQPGRSLRQRELRARRAMPLLRVRGGREPDHPQHGVDRARPRRLDQEGPAPLRCRPPHRRRASRCTWRACTSWSGSSSRAWSSSIPISNLADAGGLRDAAGMLTRLFDFFKAEGITGVFISLTSAEPGERGDGGRHLVARRYLAAAAGHRERGRTESRSVRAQIARHGALQPDSGVLADSKGYRAARTSTSGPRAC